MCPSSGVQVEELYALDKESLEAFKCVQFKQQTLTCSRWMSAILDAFMLARGTVLDVCSYQRPQSSEALLLPPSTAHIDSSQSLLAWVVHVVQACVWLDLLVQVAS